MEGITEEAVTAVTADPGILNVMLMGIGVVFAGLLLVMLVCSLEKSRKKTRMKAPRRRRMKVRSSPTASLPRS